MTTTEQRATSAASRLARFRECADAIPCVAERLALGQHFNAYESALNDEDAADEDCTMYLSIGPIDDRHSIVTVEGRAEADMIAHALTFAHLASVLSASAEGLVLVPREPTQAMVNAACAAIEDTDQENIDETDTRFWGQPWQPCARAAWSAMLAASPEPVPATNQAGEVGRLQEAFAAVEQHFTDFEDSDYSPEVADVQSRAREGLALIRSHMAGVRGSAEDVCHSAVDDCTDGRKVFVDPDAFDRLNAALGDEDYTTALATQPATSQEGEMEKVARICAAIGGGDPDEIVESANQLGEPIEVELWTMFQHEAHKILTALVTQPAASHEGGDYNGHRPNRYVPNLPAGSSLFAVNPSTAAWHYVNHAGTWQGMPSPLSVSGTGLDDYGYSQLWNAIAKATRIDGGIIAISVRDFRATLAATPTPPTLSEDLRATLELIAQRDRYLSSEQCKQKARAALAQVKAS